MKKLHHYMLTETQLTLRPYQVFEACISDIKEAFSIGLESTVEDYLRLLTVLDLYFDPVKTFGTLQFDDYETAINRQRADHDAKSSKPYSESTIYKRYNVLLHLCEYADACNVGYHNALWGCYWKNWRILSTKEGKRSKKSTDDLYCSKRTNELVKIPKSLPIDVEKALVANLKAEISATSGEAMGGLLMLYLGLRPGECCAVQYGRIQELYPGSPIHVLYIYEQLDKSEKIRPTLKTKNAYRILPIPDELWDMLCERRQAIERKTGEKIIPEYYIVNGEAGFDKVCSRSTFATKMKEMIQASKIEENVITYAASEVVRNNSIVHPANDKRRKNIELEKEPTAYLMRRNFATLMSSVCQVDENELEYLMGHKFSNGEKRSAYSNREALEKLAVKMNRRHLATPFQNNVIRVSGNAFTEAEISQITLHIKDDALQASPSGTIEIDVYDDFPNENLTITATSTSENPLNNSPLLQLTYDYNQQPPEKVSRINTKNAYYLAMKNTRASKQTRKGAQADLGGKTDTDST